MQPHPYTMNIFNVFELSYFLCIALAHDTFIKCPKSALKWSDRGPLLLQEMLRANPDIMCLEEVDHYQDFFRPELSRHGYESTFFPKRYSPCLLFPNNSGPDGCALFYRSARFELVKKKDLILKNTEGGESNQIAVLGEFRMRRREERQPDEQEKDKETKAQKHLDNEEKKNNVKDQELPLSSSIFVCVTHLKAKSEAKELRAAQGKHLIEEVTSFSQAGSPIIVAGDFNATPAEEVYSYFSSQDAHPGLKMESSYRGAHYGGNEPEFTSWKFREENELKYTIDYIWYCPENLHVERLWDLPISKEVCEAGLPCKLYPSDHVALCTEFTILPP